MTANALVPHIARSSAAIVLTIWEKWILVHEKVFELPAPPESWDYESYCNYMFLSLKINPAQQELIWEDTHGNIL